MNIPEYNAAIDGIEIDPRVRLKAATARIIERTLGDVPQEIAAQIAASRLQALAARASDLLRRGLWDRIDAALTDFASDLDEAVAFERSSGRLRLITPEGEVRRVAHNLSLHLWNPHEIELSKKLMVEGEQILLASWRAITTSKRVIVRHDPGWDDFRPITNSRTWWAAQCTPEAKIVAAEQMEAREAAEATRPFSETSGPMGQPAGAEPR